MIYKGVNFDKLIVADNEMRDFEKYIEIKGVYLHKQIYDVLATYSSDTVTYYELSSVIRYDKNLRDTLYKYLATFEEYLRANLFAKYDVANQEYLYKGCKGFERLKKDIQSKTDNSESNLYYCFQLELSPTIDLFEHIGMYNDTTLLDFRQIKELRNHVMHHNVLVLGQSTNKAQAEANLQKLKKQVTLLCKYLPEEYKSGFQTSIENLNINRKTGRHYLDKLFLENIEWNI